MVRAMSPGEMLASDRAAAPALAAISVNSSPSATQRLRSDAGPALDPAGFKTELNFNLCIFNTALWRVMAKSGDTACLDRVHRSPPWTIMSAASSMAS